MENSVMLGQREFLSAHYNELVRAYRERDRAALEWKAGGGKVVGCLGSDVPEELLIAAGYLPVRVCGDPDASGEITDRYIERAFEPLVRSQFGRIVDGSYSYLDSLVLSSSSDALVRIFYFLREALRVEPDLPIPKLYFFDLLHTGYRTSGLYNRERLRDFQGVVEAWCGRLISPEALTNAITICNENRRLQRELAGLRGSESPKISGVEALEIIGASMYMPREEHSRLLKVFLEEAKDRPHLSGAKLFVSGSPHDHTHFYELVESCNSVIVGEDHDWGNRHFAGEIDTTVDPIDGIIDRYHLRQISMNKATVSESVKSLVEQVSAVNAEGVIFYISEGDDPLAWNVPEQGRAIEKLGLPVLLLNDQPYKSLDINGLRNKVEMFVSSIGKGDKGPLNLNNDSERESNLLTTRQAPEPKKREGGTRGAVSVKRFRSASQANAYQKDWFLNMKERVQAGEPFAFINADVPMEIFRAMDIPFVVNQWWGAVCSAKQMSPYYLGLLKERGYRDDVCRYCALSLGCAFDPEPDKAPWGGLPKPTLAVSRLTCDAQGKIFELWSHEFGVPFYPLENTVPLVTPERWWEKAPRQWEDLFETHRLDLMVEELKGLIRFVETSTGKCLNETKFRQVMDLVNQQEEYYTLTRDLIARTVPAPVSMTDQVPSVMIPQWQRGTQWAVDSARLFYEEVKERVDSGEGACQNERVRLMWIGRGLWFNLGFYQHFEQQYGAAFVWSIYLAMGADAYIRHGDDPLRALASRFVGMEDVLHMPPWNSDWYVNEARKSKIHGVVHLVSEGCTQAIEGAYFIKKALEDAGIPVLDLHADPVDAGAWNEERMINVLETFIEDRLGGIKQ